ncbi:MAG: hypothetical protein U9Q29_09210 [Campylobacterota bacterium]|nr:hypothetical protein [Campylobacterota bacterium]
MKLWTLTTLCTVSLLIFSGCTATTPTPKKEAVVDSSLPVVELTQNGIFVDMNAVAFEWKSIKDPRVKGLYIYKQVADKQEYYDTVEGRFTTHYLDKKIKPDTQYLYYFKTFSQEAESPQSKITTINSLPVLQSVSWIHSIADMPRSAKIIWRPHTNQKVKSYIVERKTLEDDKWEKLSVIEGRLNAEFIDLDLKDEYVYKYRVRVLTYDNIVSTPSEIVRVVTKALPNSIINIVASIDLPKAIQLDWAKAEYKDFYRYFVYKSEDLDGSYELIAKLHNNTFKDEVGEDGKHCFYRVSSVDKDGLESEHEKLTIQGATLAKPNAPAIIDARLIDGKVELVWKVDPRIKSYTVIKKYKKGWFDAVVEEIESITSTKFTDSNIVPNTTYFYQVYGIDKHSIKSDPSIEIKLKSKEVPLDELPASVQKSEELIATPVESSEVDTQETIIPTQDFN